MLKIVDQVGRSSNHKDFDVSTAVAYIGHSTDEFRVRAVDLGNGHMEVGVQRVIKFSEADWSAQVMADHLEVVRAFREENPEEVEARNRERACRRAKTRVRRLCKAMGAATLLTLTYRLSETDLARCKADLKEFVRRVRTVMPEFRAVACFELQERGSWHVHLATCNIPTVIVSRRCGDFRSYNVLRAIWRSVTKDREGNIDVQRRKYHSKKSSAQVAAYIAKYIGKAFGEGMDAGVNRYATFGKVEVPELVELGVVGSLREALDMAFTMLDAAHAVCTHALDRWQDWYFLAAERPKQAAGG